MKKLVEAVIENLSTKDTFLFRVSCPSCAAEYTNKPLRFSKADTEPATQNKRVIYQAVYEQELMAARQIAVRTIAEHMNYCPICKRLVCNYCFRICDDLDMCVQCATELKEQGKPVLVNLALPQA